MRFLSLPGDNMSHSIDSFNGSSFFKESAIQTEVCNFLFLLSDWSTIQNPVGDSPKQNRKPTPKRKSKTKSKSKGQEGSQRAPPPYYSERASADSDDRDQDRGKRDRDRPMVHERQTIHEKIYYL